MPLASLVQSFIHIAILHFEMIIPSSFSAFIAGAQALGWFIVGGIWTRCELSELPAPGLCPQAGMLDFGKNGLVGLAIFKDAIAWTLALAYLLMVMLAVRSFSVQKSDPFKRRDELLELAAYETRVAWA